LPRREGDVSGGVGDNACEYLSLSLAQVVRKEEEKGTAISGKEALSRPTPFEKNPPDHHCLSLLFHSSRKTREISAQFSLLEGFSAR